MATDRRSGRDRRRQEVPFDGDDRRSGYERRRELDRRYNRVDVGDIVLGALLTLIIIIGGVTTVALRNTRKVVELESANRDALRTFQVLRKEQDAKIFRGLYRQCARNSVDRAFAHSRVRQSAGRESERQLELTLPIIDCRPNLSGDPPTVLPPAAQRRFVLKWERGDLNNSEQGLCRTKLDQPGC